MLRVSVVIPVRNEVEGISACLAALGRQTYPPEFLEVLVVDGGSADGTREACERAGVRVLADPGISAADARNRGIAAATGEVVAFTDGDCVPDPRWIERLVDRFERDPLVGGVGGAIRMPDEGNAWGWMESVMAPASYRGFITTNMAYRREALLEAKGFDPLLRCGEDWDLWWRVRDLGHRVVYEPGAVVLHRPSENRTWRGYLRKQAWYARNDVPTFLRRVHRVARRLVRRERAAIEPTARVLKTAAIHAAGAGLLAATPLRRSAGLAGAAILGAWAARQAWKARGLIPQARMPKLVALLVARAAVRGFATLAGLAEATARQPGTAEAFRPGIPSRRRASPTARDGRTVAPGGVFPAVAALQSDDAVGVA